MIKNQKGFSAVEILLAVAVICAVIGVGWFVLSNKPKPLSTMLETIKTDIPRSFNDVVVEQKKWAAQYVTNTPQKVEGSDYALSPQSSQTITFEQTVSPKDKTVIHFVIFKKKLGTAWSQNGSASPLAERVNSIFKKNKFTATKEGENTTFKRDDDTCLFSGTQLSCFNPDILKVIAGESKPFVDTYLTAHSEIKAKDIVVGPVTIKSQDGSGVISSSHAAGYDIAEAIVTVNDKRSIALYYKTSNSNWRYITEAGDEYGFKCGPMQADPDARKAMYDQVCLGENGQVRLDTSNRALQ
jgi:hypothetical protein